MWSSFLRWVVVRVMLSCDGYTCLFGRNSLNCFLDRTYKFEDVCRFATMRESLNDTYDEMYCSSRESRKWYGGIVDWWYALIRWCVFEYTSTIYWLILTFFVCFAGYLLFVVFAADQGGYAKSRLLVIRVSVYNSLFWYEVSARMMFSCDGYARLIHVALWYPPGSF